LQSTFSKLTTLFSKGYKLQEIKLFELRLYKIFLPMMRRQSKLECLTLPSFYQSKSYLIGARQDEARGLHRNVSLLCGSISDG
jgi:hypothetical protein